MRLTARDLEQLPQLVADTRADRAQTLRDVAAETGVPHVVVWQIENGRPAKLDTVLRLLPWLERRTTGAERRTADRVAGHA